MHNICILTVRSSSKFASVQVTIQVVVNGK